MPDRYKESTYSLTRLFSEIDCGSIALPDLQRPFVWKDKQVAALLDSMYKGYPVGNLMMWETDGSTGTRNIGVDAKSARTTKVLVDGQQRTTGLYSAVHGKNVVAADYKERRIEIAFNPFAEKFEVRHRDIRKNPEYFQDISTLFDDTKRRRSEREYILALGKHRGEPVSQQEEDALGTILNKVAMMRAFSFGSVELAEDVTLEEVSDIFVRINSEGANLKHADFTLTILSVHAPEVREKIDAFSRACAEMPKPGVKSPSSNFLHPDPDDVLRVIVALAFRRARQADVSLMLRGKGDTDEARRTDRQRSIGMLRDALSYALNLTNWRDFEKVLQQAGFRNAEMISAVGPPLHTYALYLIGKRDFNVPHTALRDLMARWFFMVHLTGYFNTAADHAVESLLARLTALPEATAEAFCQVVEQEIRDRLTPDYWTTEVPNSLRKAYHKSRTWRSYRASLCLLDADVLFDRIKYSLQEDQRGTGGRKMEKHHLFPKAYLARSGVLTNEQQNQTANMAPIDWAKNNQIGDRAPEDYWNEWVATEDPQRVAAQMFWYALPDNWAELPYEQFLVQRRVMLGQVLREAYLALPGATLSESVPVVGSRPAPRLAVPVVGPPPVARMVLLADLDGSAEDGESDGSLFQISA